MTIREMVNKYLDGNINNIFSSDYDYPRPFSDEKTRNRIAWYMFINYRSLEVDEMLDTEENNNLDFIRLFVFNGLNVHKRNIERLYDIMNKDIPILSNNDFTEEETRVYGEKNTTNITGERNTLSVDGNRHSITSNSSTSYDDTTNPQLKDRTELTDDSVTNTAKTEQSMDTSKQDTYTDKITRNKIGLLNSSIPEYIFKEIVACGFDYEKYFSKLLADILTYPIYM